MASTAPLPQGYHDLPAAAYHADPAPEPSLRAGIASILLTGTPADARWAHPRLNPDLEEDDSTKFDLGSVAHELMLGKGAGIVVVDAADWRTGAAKLARAEAVAEGKQPVLAHVFDQARVMVDAAREQLACDPENRDAFREGRPEVTALWQEATPGGRVWCRAQLDWLMPGNRLIYDYKTFKPGADPNGFVTHLAREAKDIQDPFHSRGVAAIEGCDWSEVGFRFVVQSPDPPYLLSVVELAANDGSREWSYERTSWAIELWAKCLKSGSFPGFATGTHAVGIPTWAQMQWEDRQHRAARAERNHMLEAAE